jgi:energy-coupling factor transporter ATP-binding protein EcfA2
MTDTAFSAQDLTKTYTSGEVEVRALQGANLEVLAGEVVGLLLGPSGSGKSTLLNIMGGAPGRERCFYTTHLGTTQLERVVLRVEQHLNHQVSRKRIRRQVRTLKVLGVRTGIASLSPSSALLSGGVFQILTPMLRPATPLRKRSSKPRAKSDR